MKEILNSLTKPDLRPLAKKVGIPKTVTGKLELVDALSSFVLSDLKTFVGRLTPVEQQFLAEAVYADN